MKRLFLILALAPAQAGAFSMEVPVDCTLGETCYIQQYMDRDPSPAATDFTCGPLSYEGHSGTDFALPNLAAMRAGVDVLAAAPGVVTGVRDGMPDISIRDPAAPALEGRDCGNGLVIDHGDGWETQYCHMAEGSVAVSPGQTVTAGQKLGRVGLSGNTEFPHLHLSVRRSGAEIDPFDPDGSATCGAGPVPALWADPVAYTPGGLLAVGLADAVPEYQALKDGQALPAVTVQSPALVVWAKYFGVQAGDQLQISLAGPDGAVMLDESIAMDRTQALGFRAAGKRLRAPAWPAGPYRIGVIWTRNGQVIDSADQTVVLP